MLIILASSLNEDPDQPELEDDEQRRLFEKTYWEIDHRLKIFTSLPLDKLDKLPILKELELIGKAYSEQS
jgi:arsenate reductase (thioredoxin)